MTLLPCISTLFTVNLDRDIRTGDRAQGARRTSALLIETDRAIATGIVFLGGKNQSLFTGMNAKMAFLAQFTVDDDMSLQICLSYARPHSIGWFCAPVTGRIVTASVCRKDSWGVLAHIREKVKTKINGALSGMGEAAQSRVI
jgi:hypothetical protein